MLLLTLASLLQLANPRSRALEGGLPHIGEYGGEQYWKQNATVAVHTVAATSFARCQVNTVYENRVGEYQLTESVSQSASQAVSQSVSQSVCQSTVSQSVRHSITPHPLPGTHSQAPEWAPRARLAVV